MIEKIKEMLGFTDEYYDDYEDEYEVDEQNVSAIENVYKSKNMSHNKVVNLPNTVKGTNAKIDIYKPQCMEEIAQASDSLREYKIVVINTTGLDRKIAQRMIDFISGTCYALDGKLETIESDVYILVPENIELSSDLKNSVSKSLFNWNK